MHAGCSTGEEAYSSAILLREEGLHDRTQIYATDRSTRALEDAKEGAYSDKVLPVFARNHALAGGTMPLEAHVTTAYGQIAMREPIRKNILFFQHDLVTDHVFGEMHVVFCRNVLIDFGPELRERVLRKIAESLCPGGFLCLGSSERPPDPLRGFKPFGERGERGGPSRPDEACIYRYEP